MHAGQHIADGGAVLRAGLQLAFAGKLVDHRCGLATDAEQDIAISIGLRVGHGNAGLRQVLHQVEVKRQLFGAQSFEQGQDVMGFRFLIILRAQKVIGVFNAAFDAAQLGDGSQTQLVGNLLGLFQRNFGKNGHL